MYCKNCGHKNLDSSNYCENCGSEISKQDSVEIRKESTKESKEYSEAIFKDEKGNLLWRFELNMWKNPTVLITVWKVLMIGAMFPILLVTFLSLFEDGFIDAVNAFLTMFKLMGGIMTGLTLIAYVIIAIMNGGKYQVVFELNEEGVTHLQIDKQFKKSQVASMLSVLAGVVAGNMTTTGAGLLAATKQSSYSEFKHVKKIVLKPRRHVIYVNQTLEHNQIYVYKEDFHKIADYIIARCPDAVVSR